jgi:methenyltetrahydrofolate cyclohydrolase
VETISEYLTALASEHPTPGGGSAATIVAAMGAALVAMVSRICAANPRYAAQHDIALELLARADSLRLELEAARTRDEAAFAGVVSSSRENREQALHAAATEPLRAAGLSLDVMRLCVRLLEIPNKNLTSDIGCAAEFAACAIAACAYNVRINHKFMKDAHVVAMQEQELARYERESAALLSSIRRSLL